LRWVKTTTDLAGRVVKIEVPSFGGGTNTTTYAYNDKGQLTSTTEPGKANTLYEFNELGSIIKVCLDVDNDDSIDESEMDRITTYNSYFEQDASNDWWMVSASAIYAIDNGSTATTNEISKTKLTGLSTNLTLESKSIDIFGNETVSRSSVNRSAKTVTQTVYTPYSTNDAVNVLINGLLTSSETATDLEYTFSYDGLERRTAVIDPRTGTTTTHYNSLGQIDYIEDATTNRTSYAYDASTGRKIAETNALGKVTRYEFDAKGLLIKTWGDTVYPVSYLYNDFDQMVSMRTYQAGSGWDGTIWPTNTGTADATTWQYDEATGLLTNKLYADGNGTAYSYTSDGKLAIRSWARGITTAYSYTNMSGEIIGINYSDSTPDISFTYNRVGQQVTVDDAQGSRTFSYDPDTLALTNEIIVANGVTSIIARTRDSYGRPNGLSLGDDYSVTYGYSDVGRFDEIMSEVLDVTNNWQYSYLQNSSLIEKLIETGAGITNSRNYEISRNLITEIHNQAQGLTISKYQYTNDELGRRTQRIDTTVSVMTNDFGYNTRSELTNAFIGAESFDWTFDNIGNRQTYTTNSTTYTYLANELNQYTNIANGTTNSPTYDLDGNTLTYQGWTLTWNGENRMTSASNGSTVVSFQYDYMGRRFSKVSEGVTTNLFYYDGWNLISELISQASGLSTNYCIWGLDLSGSMHGIGGVGGLLGTCMNGNMYFAYTDGNGNVTAYTDVTGTNIIAHYVYGAYGEIIDSSGDKVDDFNILFSSKYLDRETAVSGCPGMYCYGYRDLWDARWFSRDPIEENGGIPLYGYLYNSSPNNIDSLGNDILGPINPPAPLGHYIKSVKKNKKGEFPKPEFGGLEAHLGVGLGLQTLVLCQDDDYYHALLFIKYCFGPNAGVALGAGKVMEGVEHCMTTRDVVKIYSGWVMETSAGVGPAAATLDVGVEPTGDHSARTVTDITKASGLGGGVPLPRGDEMKTTGVVDVGGSGTLGLEAGITMCNYIYVGESIGDPCCECKD